MKIHFHTFRHMRGTLDAHNHVPLFEVKEKLVTSILRIPKNVSIGAANCTMKKATDNIAATSKLEQARALVETGYESLTDMDGMKLFRKPR